MQRPTNITPHQRELTPEQLAYAKWFVQERIRMQLAPGPADEAQAVAYLTQAYQTAGLPAPKLVHWLDSPMAFMRVTLAKPSSVMACVQARVRDSMEAWVRDGVRSHVEAHVWGRVWGRVWDRVGAHVWDYVRDRVGAHMQDCAWDSVQAYRHAGSMAYYRLFDELVAPHALHALAHFNEMVCGYFLEEERALLVRKPVVLERDRYGRLHSAQGKCLEFADGYGFYAWHGVRVPANVILQPHTLTKVDWGHEPHVEVRRIIQERMGERFVKEMGGICLQHGTYADLYQVELPGDPERVAKYIKLQDSSTPRQYYLRVPPQITDADAGVAWTFGLPPDDYAPVQQA